MSNEYTFRELIEAQLRGEQVQWHDQEDNKWLDTSSIIDCQTGELDNLSDDYRIKPKTRTARICNGVELPQCVTEPLSLGHHYYTPDLLLGVSLVSWGDRAQDHHYLREGLVYLSKHDAHSHYDALLNVKTREVEL